MVVRNREIFDKPADDFRRISVLGSTGSIGCNALSLIADNNENFSVVALTGNKNFHLLAEQARVFEPELVVIGSEEYYKDLKNELRGSNIRIEAGPNSLVEAASLNTDLVIAGIVGIAGLRPTIAAAKNGANVALANKESLVCAGNFLLDEIVDNNGTLLPIDSEHNAIFQVFDFRHPDSVKKLILTASGGPFREMPIEKMARVSPEEAVAHPNWRMGQKISVDSATMMNKGLEIIEAFYFFPVAEEQIDVIVHPQSVVHSMVTYTDGSVLAQMGCPDMRIPISYALAWPKRIETKAPRLDLNTISNLTFEAVDTQRFPALRVARDVLMEKGAAPIVLNAANEIAVERFLRKKIGFLDIMWIVEECLNNTHYKSPSNIDDIAAIDKETRLYSENLQR